MRTFEVTYGTRVAVSKTTFDLFKEENEALLDALRCHLYYFEYSNEVHVKFDSMRAASHHIANLLCRLLEVSEQEFSKHVDDTEIIPVAF